MKLKTVPIYIILDEVVIEAETCENFREEANSRAENKFNLNQYVFGEKAFFLSPHLMLTFHMYCLLFPGRRVVMALSTKSLTVLRFPLIPL